MADDGSQQRKPDFRTALVMKLESVLGRRLKLRSPAVLAAIGVVATLALALVVVMVLLQAGDANAVSDNAALIGALVALGGVFTAQMVSIALDDRRSHEARDLEAQRTREAALQNYFEQVGELLIEKPLHRASPGDNLSTVVRAQTLSVLGGLDPDRKRILLLFLYESGLIYKDKTVVSLVLANLDEVDLSWARLYGANLREANLPRANLFGADLREANLFGADLREANLGEADLSGAHLFGANLREADLSGADLRKAHLKGSLLTGDYLMKDPRRGSYLIQTGLYEDNLREARLSGADLSGATGITNEELEQQAKFLGGTIMPDGSKHP